MPIAHVLALRLRIVVSFCGDEIVGRVLDADQRSAVVPCFAAISSSCRKSGTNWPLTLMQFPRYGAFEPVFRAKNVYLAPAVGWFQEEWQQKLSITCADHGDNAIATDRKHG
ncbi:MAG TPA: hypothetical protein VGG82_10350 [Casimicrobiaceae bacterium]